MRLFSWYIPMIVGAVLLGAPLLAYGHAAPTSYVPEAGSVQALPPRVVEIRFTEHIEPAASKISIVASDGTTVPVRLEVDQKDSRLFRARLDAVPVGHYAVSWHVISADDGHFTKGAFGFSVGDLPALSSPATGDAGFEVSHSSTSAEALTLWLELLGHAMLLAVVVAYLFIFSRDRLNDKVRTRIHLFALVGFFLVLAGCVGYLHLKIRALGDLSNISRIEALQLLAHTTAGKYTFLRLAAAIGFIARLAWIETRRRGDALALWTMLGLALFSEFARARVSHAAASDFYPAFSVLINFIHLVFKDLWVGLVLLLAVVRTPLGDISVDLRGRISKVLALCFIVGGVTGSYIIWLHLKDPSYILTTDWGIRFIWLSVFGGLLFLARMFQEVIRPSRTALFFEAGIGVALLAATGIMIITTPPIDIRPAYELVSNNHNGATVVLSPHPVRSTEMLVKVFPPAVKELVVTLTEESRNIGPIVAKTEKVAQGEYIFSKTEMPVAGDWKVNISAVRENAYDATLEGVIHEPYEANHERSFDVLTFGVLIAILGIISFGSLWFRGKITPRQVERFEPRSFEYAFLGLAGILLFFYTFGVFVRSPFEYACIRNGHEWAVRPAVVNGVQVGEVALPGCTASGDHFPLRQEYDYFNRPASSTVSWVSNASVPSAGVPFPVSFEVKDEEGKVVNHLPAFHEAPMHIMLVSSDFLYFVHTHAKKGNPGYFDALLNFPAAGKYLVALDYTLRTTPTIKILASQAGGPRTNPFLPNWSTKTQFIGPFGISFDHESLSAGRETKLSYAITNKGEPVHSFEPHYGALMHLFAISEDQKQVVHGHVPLASQSMLGGHSHGLPVATMPHEGDLEGSVVFPTSGIYHVYGEFKVGSDVVTSHFKVNVE